MTEKNDGSNWQELSFGEYQFITNSENTSNNISLEEISLSCDTLQNHATGERVCGFLHNIPEQASKTASQLWNSMKEAYPHMKEGFNNCLSYMADALNPKTAPERISNALQSVGNFFNELREQIKNDDRPIGVKLSETWNAFTKMITEAYNKFTEKASPVLSAAGEKFAQAWDSAKASRAASMAANAAEKAKEVGKDLIGRIYDVGKSIYNSIPGMKKDNDPSKGM